MICYSSEHHQNVPKLEKAFLVAWDEEACHHFYFTTFDMSIGQGRASKTIKVASTFTDTIVEMRAYYYRLCGWFVEDTGRVQWYLGSCGSTNEDFTFSFVQDKVVRF